MLLPFFVEYQPTASFHQETVLFLQKNVNLFTYVFISWVFTATFSLHTFHNFKKLNVCEIDVYEMNLLTWKQGYHRVIVQHTVIIIACVLVCLLLITSFWAWSWIRYLVMYRYCIYILLISRTLWTKGIQNFIALLFCLSLKIQVEWVSIDLFGQAIASTLFFITFSANKCNKLQEV